MQYRSQYVTMRDGVKLAVDIYLPLTTGRGEKVPTVLHQTRYMRSVQLRPLLKKLNRDLPFDHSMLFAKRRRRMLKNGYAWVDVDVRGSGASYGKRIAPWYVDEIRDGADVVDFIIKQPWSDGTVGSLGISYSGTTAEFLLVNKHPAVRAVAPRFALFDIYSDISHPGGIRAEWFLKNWRKMNDALDRNAPHEIAGWWAKLFITGVNPVAEDRGRVMLKEILKNRTENFNVYTQSREIVYRDDIWSQDPLHRGELALDDLPGSPLDLPGSIALISPHSYADDIEASGAAVYSYSGWLDGAYQHAAIKRFLRVKTPGSRLIVGGWNHGGGWNINQRDGPRRSDFDHDGELLGFFDKHLKGIDSPITDAPPVRYFTMVEEKWKTADSWPVAGAQNRIYYLARENRLGRQAPAESRGEDIYRVDDTANSGQKTRFRTLVEIDGKVKYGDRRRADEKLLVYTSEALTADTEVTGHPVVTLFVSSTAEDGIFICYLEDVSPTGRVTYVTEGHLRAIHRRLSDKMPPYPHPVPFRTFRRADAMPLVPAEIACLKFDLLPTSYLFEKGHAIRLAIAGADTSHFENLPESPPTLRFQRNATHASCIELPIVRG